MRAIVTIIDEKTGHVFEENKILEPYREQRDPRLCVTEYEYRFKHSVMDWYFKAQLDGEIEPNEELLREIGMEETNKNFHCGVEEYYQWDKKMRGDTNEQKQNS